MARRVGCANSVRADELADLQVKLGLCTHRIRLDDCLSVDYGHSAMARAIAQGSEVLSSATTLSVDTPIAAASEAQIINMMLAPASDR